MKDDEIEVKYLFFSADDVGKLIESEEEEEEKREKEEDKKLSFINFYNWYSNDSFNINVHYLPSFRCYDRLICCTC